jgi:hypothetical protein
MAWQSLEEAGREFPFVTGKWENSGLVPFILNKPFVDEAGYNFWVRLNADYREAGH